jgi:hypothetical protein
MSDAGSPQRRSVSTRSAALGLAGAGIVAAAGWAGYRHLHPPVPAAPVATLVSAEQPAAQAAAPASPPLPAPAPAPAAPAAPRPSFDVVRVAPGGDAVVAGRAAPNAAVTLLDNGKPIATGTANQNGQFVILPDQKLPAGAQELALQATTPGAPPVAGDTPALLVVPDRGGTPAAAEAKPQAAPPAPGTGAIAVLTPPDAAPRLLTVPADPPGTPTGQVALRVVDYGAHDVIRFAGTAKPGSTVRLYIDNAPVGEAQADGAGRWSLMPAGPVAPGPHRLRADALGAGGKVVSRAELPFDQAAFAADAAGGDKGGGKVVVQPRQTLWRIARHVYGQGMRYTVIYAANRDQIRDPARIYPGQVFTLPGPIPAPVQGGAAHAN